MKRYLPIAIVCGGLCLPTFGRVVAQDFAPMLDKPNTPAPAASPSPSASPEFEPPKPTDVFPQSPAVSGGFVTDARPSAPSTVVPSSSFLPWSGASPSNIAPTTPSVGNAGHIPFPGSPEYMEFLRNRRQQVGGAQPASGLGTSPGGVRQSAAFSQPVAPAASLPEPTVCVERVHAMSGS